MWNYAENKVELKSPTQIVFVRHGKTAGNLEGRYIGITDEVLCEAGKQQLLSRGYPEVDLVFSSPMRRCLETAQIIWGMAKAQIIDGFEEIDFGDFEGKSYEELKDNGNYQRWIDSNGTLPFPNGGSREDFIETTLLGFNQMLMQINEKADASNDTLRVGVVAHGGTIMSVMSSLFDGDYFDYQVKNTEGYVLSYNPYKQTWNYKKI